MAAPTVLPGSEARPVLVPVPRRARGLGSEQAGGTYTGSEPLLLGSFGGAFCVFISNSSQVEVTV